MNIEMKLILRWGSVQGAKVTGIRQMAPVQNGGSLSDLTVKY